MSFRYGADTKKSPQGRPGGGARVGYALILQREQVNLWVFSFPAPLHSASPDSCTQRSATGGSINCTLESTGRICPRGNKLTIHLLEILPPIQYKTYSFSLKFYCYAGTEKKKRIGGKFIFRYATHCWKA